MRGNQYDHILDHHAEVENSFAAADSHLWALFVVLAATTAIDFIIFGLGTVGGPFQARDCRGCFSCICSLYAKVMNGS